MHESGIRAAFARLCAGGTIVAILSLTSGCGRQAAAPAPTPDAQPAELTRVLERIMAAPELRAEEGFAVRVLVPPGHMYDPLWLRARGNEVWVNDDGGEEGARGSQILAIDRHGRLSTIVELGRLVPVTGFDIAPAGFGSYGGQIFGVSQPEATLSGATKNHIVQRVDPAGDSEGSVFCTLPSAGVEGKGIPGYGSEAVFGPEGSPFAGRFFSVTPMNNTVYQTTADGKCSPFVIFDNKIWGKPGAIAFSADKQHMLMSTFSEREGAIARVRPDGTIEPNPLVRSEKLSLAAGIAYAPESFGSYGGQLFIAVLRGGGFEIGLTQPVPANGTVYRLTPEGELKLVASGFHTPVGLHFLNDRLWVSDINGDFIGGRRELPDGFIGEITLAP